MNIAAGSYEAVADLVPAEENERSDAVAAVDEMMRVRLS